VSRANVKYEILQGGIEISAATPASSGTLGAIVTSTETGKPMILTNRHVVSDDADEEAVRESLNLLKLKVKAGAQPWWWKEEYCELLERYFPVFQPAYRGGSKESRLVAWVTLASKASDAAVCTLADGVKSDPAVLANPSYRIPAIGKARNDMLVMKSGKETEVTWGVVTAISDDNIIIEHPFHDVLPVPGARQATSSDPAALEKWSAESLAALEKEPNLRLQSPLVQGAISAAGDSGAVWVSAETREAVGLLYKGLSPFHHGKNYSVAKDMESVAKKLKFSFQ
jgi:hypothetical protein